MARIDTITASAYAADNMTLHEAITITAAVEFVDALIAESPQLRDMFREHNRTASEKIHSLAKQYVGIDSNGRPLDTGDLVRWKCKTWRINSKGDLCATGDDAPEIVPAIRAGYGNVTWVNSCPDQRASA